MTRLLDRRRLLGLAALGLASPPPIRASELMVSVAHGRREFVATDLEPPERMVALAYRFEAPGLGDRQLAFGATLGHVLWIEQEWGDRRFQQISAQAQASYLAVRHYGDPVGLAWPPDEIALYQDDISLDLEGQSRLYRGALVVWRTGDLVRAIVLSSARPTDPMATVVRVARMTEPRRPGEGNHADTLCDGRAIYTGGVYDALPTGADVPPPWRLDRDIPIDGVGGSRIGATGGRDSGRDDYAGSCD